MISTIATPVTAPQLKGGSVRTAGRALFASVALLVAAACGERGDRGAAVDSPAVAPPPAAPVDTTPAAPDSFRVRFETTKGTFVVQLNRAWSPRGVDRFHQLVREGYFTDVRFFRVLAGFVVQFGMHGDPAVNAQWKSRTIRDEPVATTNARGTLTFAKAGPHTRSNQFFINLGNNGNLDAEGFPPIGRVVQGMSVVDAINSEYGEGPPTGTGPDQMVITERGNEYLAAEFPRLDYIRSATVIE